MRVTAMDKDAPYEDVSEIQIPFPEKKYKKLLKICNLDEKSKLGSHQMSQILVNGTYHFLLGHLSQDELSAISGYLWSEIKGSSQEKTSEIGNALLAADELAYYIRRIYSKDRKHGGFDEWMVQVMEYYDKHRNLVVKEV